MVAGFCDDGNKRSGCITWSLSAS